MLVKVITPTNKELLKQQIELEESNFKYALELRKDANMLLKMRNNINELKEKLRELEEEQ